MPISNRNLPAGTKLVAKYKGEIYHATVIATDDGIRYRLEEPLVIGQKLSYFKSPSAAGAAIFGEGRTCNGWAFWSVEGEEPEATEAAEAKPEAKTKGKRQTKVSDYEHHTRSAAAKKAAATRRARAQTKNGADAAKLLRPMEDGRWFCNACLKTFTVADDQPPTDCPEGHVAKAAGKDLVAAGVIEE